MRKNKFRKIYININSECNYKCVSCLLSDQYKNRNAGQAISLENLRGTITKMLPFIKDGVRNICEISGGEPTIHPEFHKILSYLAGLRRKGVFYKLVLLTNGHLLAKKNRAKEAALMLDDVVITFYTSNFKQHDRITGIPGSLKQKMQAVDNLLNFGTKVHIKMIIMKPSFKLLPKLARLIIDRWGSSVRLTINGIHLIGNAKINCKKLAVRYSEAMPYIEDMLDIVIPNELSVALFVPMCLLDPIYWKFMPINYKEIIKKSYSVTPDGKMGKARLLLREFLYRHPICKKCFLNKRCNWPWEEYVSIFGDKEIREGQCALITKRGLTEF